MLNKLAIVLLSVVLLSTACAANAEIAAPPDTGLSQQGDVARQGESADGGSVDGGSVDGGSVDGDGGDRVDTEVLGSQEEASADIDFSGRIFEVTGPETDPEIWTSIQSALDVFAERTGSEVNYTGLANWEDEMAVRIAADSTPDIAIFPQPGLLAEFAAERSVVPVPDDVVDALTNDWPSSVWDMGEVTNRQYGVPVSTELQSVVWFDSNVFGAGGYTAPTTVPELFNLTAVMIADGITPWCVGIDAGDDTGSVVSDWVESIVLSDLGAEVYDQWVSHEVAFSDPRIALAIQRVLDLWITPGAVNGGFESIALTNAAPVEDLLAGNCAMVRQTSGFATGLPEDADHVGWFLFPSLSAETPPIVAGTFAAAFESDPAISALLEFLGSSEYANARQVAQREAAGNQQSGFTTANRAVDLSLWSATGGDFVQFLAGSSRARFDASEMMPATVSPEVLNTQLTAFIQQQISVQDAVAAIDAAWPVDE